MKGLISLKNYLGKTNLADHLHLTKSITFHWSNWDQTCLLQKQYYKNFNNNLHLTVLNNSLLDLKSKQVWLCNKVGVVRTNLYSLYESYLDSRLRLTWLERKDEILFSTTGEQGPYYAITTMKWFNKDIYAQFVMRKILIEQFTMRSFRLNTSIPIVLKFDNDVNNYYDKVSIHQLSEAGLILRINDKNFVNKIKNSHVLECKIPIQIFQSTLGLNFHDAWKKLDNFIKPSDEHYKTYQLESRIFNFYGNMPNAQRSGDDEFYIFARYEDLLPEGHNVSLAEIFVPLILKTKKHFLKDMDLLTPEKLSA